MSMARQRRYQIDPSLFLVTCTLCTHEMHVSQVVRVDGSRVRCTSCGGAFEPISKGTGQRT